MTAHLRDGRILNDQTRDAVLAAGVSFTEVARRCGWIRPGWDFRSPGGDVTRLQRQLGLKPYRVRGRYYANKTISQENALLIADALNLDPVDVGV